MRMVDVGGIRYTHGDRTTEYLIHNTDDTNDTKYYGFVDFRGCWIIMKEVTSTGAFTYSVGKQNYSTAWTNRASQTYGAINSVMP